MGPKSDFRNRDGEDCRQYLLEGKRFAFIRGSPPTAGYAFLPSVYQGVQCRTQGEPVLYLSNSEGMSRSLRRKTRERSALRPTLRLGWDHHGNARRTDIRCDLPDRARDIDRPTAALIRDLKQRGLLDQTLIVWGGEFGRTPMRENRQGAKTEYYGRDHHPYAFTMWLAGGGIQGGVNHGATDDIGYYVDRDPVTSRDLQATLLHLLGLDPYEFHYPYQGLKQRLIGPTDEGRIVRELLG